MPRGDWYMVMAVGIIDARRYVFLNSALKEFHCCAILKKSACVGFGPGDENGNGISWWDLALKNGASCRSKLLTCSATVMPRAPIDQTEKSFFEGCADEGATVKKTADSTTLAM